MIGLNLRGLVPKYQWGTSGISNLDTLELLRKSNPDEYNRILIENARRNSPNSEIIRYIDADGNFRTTTNVGAGYVSGTDPVGLWFVETAASAKPLQWIGKAITWGLGNLPGILKMITHPTWLKVYHGTRKKFTWQEAKPYSKGNIGLHVSPNKRIADNFARNNGYVMEGYAPKPKVETIDIWYNNYDLLNNKYRFEARPRNSGSSYHIVLPDTKRLEMLEKAGAEPTHTTMYGVKLIHTENTVNLNLRDLLKLSKRANKEADNLMLKSKLNFDNKDEILNKEATDLLRNDGIKSIRYNNNNYVEGGGGESWILTEPWKVWNPTWKPIYTNINLQYSAPIIPLINNK